MANMKEEKISIQKLKSGAILVSEPVPTAKSIYVAFYIKAGSVNENKDLNGISHLIEHSTFKGTRNYSGRSISTIVENKGGFLDAFTSTEYTSYYGAVLTEDKEILLDILTDLVFYPSFDWEEINNEKLVIYEEIKGIMDSPDHTLLQKAYEAVFGPDSSLALPVEGKIESIRSLDRKNILNYWRQYYTSENLIISATGNFKRNELSKFLNKILPAKSETKNYAYQMRLNPQNNSKIVNISNKKHLHQVYVAVSRPAFPYADKRRLPLLIVNTVLGSGMSSLLFQKFREENPLVYSITSFANLYKEKGIFGVYFSTSKNNLNKSLKLLKNIFNDFSIGKETLERVKSRIKGSLLLSLEALETKLSYNFKQLFYTEETKSADEFVKELNSITIDEVNELKDELLQTDNYHLNVVGSVKDVIW